MSKKVASDGKEKIDNSKYIVGIGASAGGLEALQKLLTALPCNTGFPYIVVQTSISRL